MGNPKLHTSDYSGSCQGGQSIAVAVVPSGGELAKNAELIGDFFTLFEQRNNERIRDLDRFKVVEGRGASVLVLISDQ